MNLPPLLERTVRQLQQQVVAQAETASLATELKVGRVLSAAITEISALTDAERQEAIQRLQQQLASAPHAKPETQAQLKEWLGHPQLYLVALKVAQRQVHAITPTALQLDQPVKVLLRPDGQLQLLPPDSHSARPLAQDSSRFAYNLSDLKSPTATPSARQTPPSQPGSTEPNARLREQTATLAANLRSSLPKQESHKTLLQLLDKLTATLGSAPPAVRSAMITPPLHQALAQIQAHSYAPEELCQPQVLKRAIHQSGTLLESRLAGQASLVSTNSTAGRSAAQREGNSPLTAAASILPTKNLPNHASTADAPPTPASDMKAALLQALHLVQTQLGSAPSQPNASKPVPTQDTLVLSLLGLLQKGDDRQKAKGEVKGQLLQALQQQLVASLAKVQTQQLQSLNQRLTDSASSQGAQFDIPVRGSDGYGCISIHIQEFWNREAHEHSSDDQQRRENEKSHQWEVFLEFDLGKYGQLASQLKVQDGTVSAQFWADSENTRALAAERVSELRQAMEDSGLKVKDVQCLKGSPPRRDVKLNYNLVDITT